MAADLDVRFTPAGPSFIDTYPEAACRFSAVAPRQWLRLAAIASSATQGLVLLTLGAWLLGESSNIPDGLAAMAQERSRSGGFPNGYIFGFQLPLLRRTLEQIRECEY